MLNSAASLSSCPSRDRGMEARKTASYLPPGPHSTGHVLGQGPRQLSPSLPRGPPLPPARPQLWGPQGWSVLLLSSTGCKEEGGGDPESQESFRGQLSPSSDLEELRGPSAASSLVSLEPRVWAPPGLEPSQSPGQLLPARDLEERRTPPADGLTSPARCPRAQSRSLPIQSCVSGPDGDLGRARGREQDISQQWRVQEGRALGWEGGGAGVFLQGGGPSGETLSPILECSWHAVGLQDMSVECKAKREAEKSLRRQGAPRPHPPCTPLSPRAQSGPRAWFWFAPFLQIPVPLGPGGLPGGQGASHPSEPPGCGLTRSCPSVGVPFWPLLTASLNGSSAALTPRAPLPWAWEDSQLPALQGSLHPVLSPGSS